MALNRLNRDNQLISVPIRSHLSAGISGFFSVGASPKHKLVEPDLLASGCSSA